MIFYTTNFITLGVACSFLFFHQRSKDVKDSDRIAVGTSDAGVVATLKDATSKFTRLYLVVYALTMGADWLQGAHIYALYREQMGFSEETVASFFTAGFLSGAVSAYFVGSLADRLGRRLICLTYCVAYTLSCLSTLYRSKPVLYGGRLLGGVSTSILYSCFESWMVTEFHSRGLSRGGALSHLFGVLTAANSIVAIAAGVSSEWLVGVTGTRESPFMASCVLLGIAFVAILVTWNENYGSRSSTPGSAVSRNALSVVFNDKRILALVVASCCLEASMYIFVFLWSPSLQAVNSSDDTLPYGIIFANFMASMMLGSYLFNLVAGKVIRHSRLLVWVFAAAAVALYTAVYAQNEYAVFYGFCVFEACVGMYFPAMGVLKGRIIEDGHRAAVYGVLRIPLNVVVVAALGVVGRVERESLLLFCCAMLVAACGFVGHYID
ncbi:uncharacterized protein H6S33_000527 [Morchella sextelata]|uniref:uncharacterized protein n=1 Tax=Morchella sextelata TaxID=1174677 RepID=UPI001D045FF9|nr:uncharacterized protein H6S33_000527 [Morchella sextelata]KAH0614891.1 hypothetical protein H6S33_000527 [Morchella sextelata]